MANVIVPGIRFVQGRNSYADGDGRKYGIAIHNTSNSATAEGEATYATRRTDGVSSHFYCDADSVVQSLDTAAKAGHAGSSAGNDNAICVEITGTNDKSRAWWLANVAWDQLGRVLAAVIRSHWSDGTFRVRRASVAEMQANPKIKAFYSHDDMRRAWGGTTHTDPGPGFPWDRLFDAVNAALGDDMNFPRKGDSGMEVRFLQLGLNRLAALTGAKAIPVTDVYDAATCASVVGQLQGAADGEYFHAELKWRLEERLATAWISRAITAALAELPSGGAGGITSDQAEALTRELLRHARITVPTTVQ